MILVDSSVWVDHFARGEQLMFRLLENREVFGHPLVTGEVAMGSLRQRELKLGAMQKLPQADVAHAHEVLRLVERQNLGGTGLQYIDAHLLASALLMGDVSVWTRDNRLLNAARKLQVAFEEPQVHLQ